MRTLLVGGTKSFYKNSLRGNLTDLGLDIAWHIDSTSTAHLAAPPSPKGVSA